MEKPTACVKPMMALQDRSPAPVFVRGNIQEPPARAEGGPPAALAGRVKPMVALEARLPAAIFVHCAARARAAEERAAAAAASRSR